jgi:hypothetical protein
VDIGHTRRLIKDDVVDVGQLDVSVDKDKLLMPEVVEDNGTQRRMRQEVEQFCNAVAHLGRKDVTSVPYNSVRMYATK